MRDGEDANVRKAETNKVGAKLDAPFGLEFMDASYSKDLGTKALICAKAKGWITEDAIICWEEEAVQVPPEGFTALDQRRYGGTHITFLEIA